MRLKFVNLLICMLLCSCGTSQESASHKYEYDDVKDKMIDCMDVFNDKPVKYYIYYFQLTCYHCYGIKSKVISYSLNLEIPFYFVEIKEDIGFLSHSKEETIGTNDSLKAFSMMTPQLSLIEYGYIISTYIGEEEILNIIES